MGRRIAERLPHKSLGSAALGLVLVILGVLTWRQGLLSGRRQAGNSTALTDEATPQGPILHRLRDQYGSRAWLWGSFLLWAALTALASRNQGGADFGAICQSWGGCLFMVPLLGFLLSGSTLAFSLLLLGWLSRTRRWVYAGGFILTACTLVMILYVSSRG